MDKARADEKQQNGSRHQSALHGNRYLFAQTIPNRGGYR